MFERLRDALRTALDAATPPGDLRDLARQMREAVVEAKLAVGETREAVARTERDLTQERQRLADAERRGRLASEIQDLETVDVAQRFAAKHRERVQVLEKKLAALQGELALYERELGDMQGQLVRGVLSWFRDAFGPGPRTADGRRSGGSMDIKRDRMVFLGYSKYWRSDAIIGL